MFTISYLKIEYQVVIEVLMSILHIGLLRFLNLLS